MWKRLGSSLGIKNCPEITYEYNGNIPTSFDARAQWPPCISPIRDQGDCGSCWAVASSSVLADRYCIQSNNTVRRLLSPQYMLGCDTMCQYPILEENCNSGCNGGYMDNAWSFFVDYGVVKDTCIPYLGENENCMGSCSSGVTLYNQTEFKALNCYQLSSVRDAQIEIMFYGPIQTGFTVYEDFEEYTGGVYSYSSGESQGGHSVRIIGWGVQDGTDYWLVANSWGTDWGLNGYFMIQKGVDECGIEDNMLAGMPNLASVTTSEYGPWVPPSGAATVNALNCVSFIVLIFILIF